VDGNIQQGAVTVNLPQVSQVRSFAGCTFVVTGGAGVLGGEVACALAGVGANVVILDRNVKPVEGLLERMGPHACRVEVLQGDVLSRERLSRIATLVAERFGRVDGLVNAAGGNQRAATTSPDVSFFDLPEDALRFVFDLNLVGTILPCQVFGRQMAERGTGVILNFSSINAFRPLTRIPAYPAAKAGVANFTQWLAVHMAQNYAPAIRVNAIAPGFFLTEQNRYLLMNRGTGEPTARLRTILEHTPIGRLGAPEDLCGAALWLLSPASAFVTGITVPVDGGFSATAGV
jgi:NAD(P)-dependent dehydrogenase (short-subunit alcohol dehydrogenase family)